MLPYRPRAIVLYAGENDLSGPGVKAPAAVLEDFRRFAAPVEAASKPRPGYHPW